MLTIKDVKVFKQAVRMLPNEFTKQDYEREITAIVGRYHQITPGHEKMVDHGLLEKVRTQLVDRMVERDVWRYPDGVMILESEYHDKSWDEQKRFDEQHRVNGEQEKIVTIKYPQQVRQNVWRVNKRKLDEVIAEFKHDMAELLAEF